MMFEENEIKLIREFSYKIFDKIFNENEVFIIVNLLFSLNVLPVDVDGICLFTKHNVDPSKMRDKILDWDNFDWLILYGQLMRNQK